MIKVETIQKVSQMNIVMNTLAVGTTSKELHGVMANDSDEIQLWREGNCVDKFEFSANKFISFNKGILYHEKDGMPLSYFGFEKRKSNLVTPNDYYVSPSQIRSNSISCVIVQMDENFNQKFYLLSSSFEKILLPQFPKVLLNENFLYYDKSKLEKYSLSSLKLEWEVTIDPVDQVERRNQGGAVFSDGENVYIRLKGGKLKCLTLLEGKKQWELTSENDQVSFSEYGDFVYVHTGDGIIEVEKSSGRIVRNLNYSDIKALDDFGSNGIIWCFEKILVTRNSFTGDLAVFNRLTLELIHREVVDKAGIPESRDCIKFLDDYLYILSTFSRLHIYELADMRH